MSEISISNPLDSFSEVTYHRQKTIDDIYNLYKTIPAGVAGRDEALQIFSRLSTASNSSTNALNLLTDEEVDTVSDVLNDYPDIIAKVSNRVWQYQENVLSEMRNVPMYVNGTAIYPDEEGFYHMNAGPVHAIDYLERNQQQKMQTQKSAVMRGFLIKFED
jgi:hypothetical protein